MKLYVKVSILIAAIALAIGVFNTFWSGKSIKQALLTENHKRVGYLANGIATAVNYDRKYIAFGILARDINRLVNTDPTIQYIYVSGKDGSILAHTFDEGIPSNLKQLDSLRDKRSVQISTYNSKFGEISHIVHPVFTDKIDFLHVGMTNRDIEQTVINIEKQQLFFAIFVIIVGVIVGSILVLRVTNPLSDLAENMRNYGLGSEISQNVSEEENRGQEVMLLTDAFRQMQHDRQKLEHTLLHKEAEFEAMFNSMIDGVLFANTLRQIRLFNPAFAELFGYSREELIGMSAKMIYADPNDYIEQGERRYRAGEGTDGEPYEVRYKKKNGNIFISETRGAQVKDNQGNMIGYVSIVRDITEQRRRREELNHFKNTLDKTLDCVFMFRPDSLRFFYVNKGAIEQVGYAQNQLLSMTPIDIKPEFDEHKFRELIKPLINRTRKALTFETIHKHKNGYFVSVEIFLQYIASKGESPRFVEIVRDITERKQAQQALHEQHQQMTMVINSAPLILWALDLDGVFTISVGKGLLDLGLRPGQVVGQSAFDLFGDNSEVIADLRRALKGESFVSQSNIANRYYETFYAPVLNSKGKLLESMGVAVDITERKTAETELRKHRDHLEELVTLRTRELESANKELEAFSYSVSHDLRAPLRTIDGFSLALVEDYYSELDAEAQDYLNRIRNGAQRMGQLIDDLLQLSRVTRSELVREVINLSETAQSIVKELKRSDQKRSVNIVIEPNIVSQGDKNLIQIVLQNLLANAWKYTNRKEVATIEFGRLNSKENNVYFVRDNGAGFDMKYSAKLFGAFQRLHSIEEFEGTGIGLATVQRIINRHGGSVWAEGQPEKGATFYFKLPTN